MSSETGPPEVVDLRAGSEVAWHDAVRLLGPPLRAFVAVRGAADPDDVLGDVFLELSRRIDDVEGGWTGLRTLAFVIARRRLIDDLRRAARRPTRPVDTADLDRAAGGDVEREAMDRLERQWVLGLLEVLTPIQRDVLTLRFVSGLGVREVAEVTGSTETAVKANQRRAVAALRRHLARDDGDGSPDLAEMAQILGDRS